MTDGPSFFNEHYRNVALTKKKKEKKRTINCIQNARQLDTFHSIKGRLAKKKMYVNVIDTRSHLLKKGLIWFTTTCE